MNEEYRGQTAIEKKRETAASIVLSMLEKTAAIADQTVAIVTEKTDSVTRQDAQVSSANKLEPGIPNESTQQFPPLFSRIKELTELINNSLARINDVMRRCEL